MHTTKVPSKKVDISIIIRAKNEEKNIEKLLGRILAQSATLSFEVLLINDNSTDQTVSKARKFPGVRIFNLKSGAFTHGYALNFAAQKSYGKIVVNISADCLPVDNSWLAKLVKPLLPKKNVVATYGAQIPIPGANPIEEIEFLTIYPQKSNVKPARTAFSNANCAISKTFLTSHPFNETVPGLEDRVWYEEIKRTFQIKYIPQAGVYHSHDITNFKRMYAKIKEIGRAYYYLKKYHNIDIGAKRKELTSIKRSLGTGIRYAIDICTFMIKNNYYKTLL